MPSARRKSFVNPGEEPFHDPSPRLHGETDLIRFRPDDLDGNQCGICDLIAGVGAVGERSLNPS